MLLASYISFYLGLPQKTPARETPLIAPLTSITSFNYLDEVDEVDWVN